jgi:hypothetical protein
MAAAPVPIAAGRSFEDSPLTLGFFVVEDLVCEAFCVEVALLVARGTAAAAAMGIPAILASWVMTGEGPPSMASE